MNQEDDWIDTTPPNPCEAKAHAQAALSLARGGRVLARLPLSNSNGTDIHVAAAIEHGGRFAFVRAPAFECWDCDQRQRCERLDGYGLGLRASLEAARWFETLAALQAHLSDEFLQAPEEHFRLDGWSRFVEQVQALGPFNGSEDAALDGCPPQLGQPLLSIAESANGLDAGSLLQVTMLDDRFGLVREQGSTRRVTWFESLGELQAFVLNDFERDRSSDHAFFVRTSWQRLKSGVLGLPGGYGDHCSPTQPGARARHVFPERLVQRPEGGWYWTGQGNWDELLWDLGDVIVRDQDEGYSGDTRVVLRKRGRFGFVVIGWGSCSGCDALQMCRSYREVAGVMRHVENSIRWFETLVDLQRYVADDGERRCSHYFHSRNWQRFRDAVLALSAAAVGDANLHLEEERARRLFPDAVAVRSDGDLRWEAPHDYQRLIGALGSVLTTAWLGSAEDDDRFYTAALLQGPLGFAFLVCEGNVARSEDPLARCRHYRDVEDFLRSLAGRLTWQPSIAHALEHLGGCTAPPALSPEGQEHWRVFVDSARELVQRP